MEIQNVTVNDKEYRIIRLLGHGKGGYSYLVEHDSSLFVLKQIHHEPCDYYTFGNKMEAELNDYQRLLNAEIRIPKMITYDLEKEVIIKEYIEGDTVFDYVKNNLSVEPYIIQVREMAQKAKEHGLNIDYYPTNFVINDGLIWYVDYECNEYQDEWSFEKWGIKYWVESEEFQWHLKKKGVENRKK